MSNHYQLDNQYQLDNNYITNFTLKLQNLKNNSDSIINDLNLLEELLEEIKVYNNKGYDINNIIVSINIHNNDLKMCLIEVYNNIKQIDNKFNIQTTNLKNKTNTIIKKNKPSNKLCCWCFKL